MNNREIAEYTLEKLTKLGADAASVGVAHGSTDELNVDGGEFSLMRTLFDTNVGMKVIKDGKKGNISINQTDKQSIDEACATVIASAEQSQPDEAHRIAPFAGKEKFTLGVLEPDIAALYDRINEFLRTTKQDYPKIMMEQFIAQYERENALYMNTNGTEFEQESGEYSISSMFSAHEGEKAGSFNGADALFTDLNTPLIDLAGHRRLFGESERSLDPVSVDGKFVGTLIATPPLMEVFLYSICGNFCSDGVIIDKTSPWIDKLGKTVASSGLTISSRPYAHEIVCGERFAEGFKSEDMDIIKDGVLKNFVLSDYGARKTGFERAKNHGANFFVTPGSRSVEEMIAGVERGLIVNRFSGGEPSANGDFSGVAKNSFLVENGKIVGAVSETMINGNFAEMLGNVREISRETEGGGRRVLPWVAFGGITVSGK